jgi:hypothetical protein
MQGYGGVVLLHPHMGRRVPTAKKMQHINITKTFSRIDIGLSLSLQLVPTTKKIQCVTITKNSFLIPLGLTPHTSSAWPEDATDKILPHHHHKHNHKDPVGVISDSSYGH